jgi:hypothetical protein
MYYYALYGTCFNRELADLKRFTRYAKNQIESDFLHVLQFICGFKTEIWNNFLENAISTLHNDVFLQRFHLKNKLLTLYFAI